MRTALDDVARDDGARVLAAAVERAGGSLVAVDDNPIDAVWSDRPAAPCAPIELYPEAIAGTTRAAKRQQIADGLTVDTSPARAGDLVKVHGSDWWRIKRVNPKTFTVTWGHSEIRVPHHNVTALRAADGTQNDR